MTSRVLWISCLAAVCGISVGMVAVGDQPQVGKRILDFSALEESQTAETDDSSLDRLTRNCYFADRFTLFALKPAELTSCPK